MSILQIRTDGYPTVMLIHDEDVAETPDSPQFTAEKLSAHLARERPWAPGLPLAASGFEGQRYRKQ